MPNRKGARRFLKSCRVFPSPSVKDTLLTGEIPFGAICGSTRCRVDHHRRSGHQCSMRRAPIAWRSRRAFWRCIAGARALLVDRTKWDARKGNLLRRETVRSHLPSHPPEARCFLARAREAPALFRSRDARNPRRLESGGGPRRRRGRGLGAHTREKTRGGFFARKLRVSRDVGRCRSKARAVEQVPRVVGAEHRARRVRKRAQSRGNNSQGAQEANAGRDFMLSGRGCRARVRIVAGA